ncbi:hypothetical protein P8625_00120 [Tenacibaculum tangerinum]|uniref:Uncharacterized protein n=1 Tax=Tenacibaculum tangerinum TaxID=3038772 RepID=A0ABY8L4R4_9FLAO|nr:hypothetical protein [Tenacibaculum tangerinum]WGH75602.1 hypothetical protein P8625_00120 [Tenacibaculum tangerinum]
MKYFKLTFSNTIKELGKFPQSEECILGDIQQDFIPLEGRIDFDFTLPEPILEKKAKKTSYVKVVAISDFLVIDDDFLAFLKSFNIGNYQDWKIKTWQNKQLITNYNLFLINDTKQGSYIDFSNSEFYSKKLGDWDNSSIQQPVLVNNYDEYVFKQKELRKDQLMLLHRKVTLNLSKATEDMFRIVNASPGGYFVSEKLKNAIEENGFTGMEFIEVSELDNVAVIY